jgi:Tol biopolymer transport system component
MNGGIARRYVSVAAAVMAVGLAWCASAQAAKPPKPTPTPTPTPTPVTPVEMAFGRCENFGPTVDRQCSVWVSDRFAGNARRVPGTSPGGSESALSPDGRRVVYLNTANNSTILDITNVDGSGHSSLANGRWPRWSPNGDEVIYADSFLRDPYIISTSTRAQRLLIDWPGVIFDPTFSPDGTEVAFVSHVGPDGSSGYSRIWRVTNGGSLIGEVIPGAWRENIRHPRYSPDGRRLAFVADVSGPPSYTQIRTVNLNGSAQRGVHIATHRPERWRGHDSLEWAPDGRLLFSRNVDGSEYYDGSNLFQILPSEGADATNLTTSSLPLADFGPSARQTVSSAGFDLAAKFRPLLRFDSSEHWRPQDIDSFLSEGGHKSCPDRVSPASCIDASRPTDLTRFGATTAYLDIAGTEVDDYRSSVPACVSDDVWDCGGGTRSAIYYHTVRSPGGYDYLDYWWFYRFNNVPDVIPGAFDHEGDWEGMSVAPSRVDPATFDYASFAQHTGWYSYLRENLRCDDGEWGSCGEEDAKEGRRLQVYVANGTHASYPFPCSESLDPPHLCFQQDGNRPELGYDGAREWANNPDDATALALHPFPSAPSWTAWAGRWGASQVGADEAANSPKSPGQQTRFAAPWASLCAGDNDACARSSRVRVATRHELDRRCGTWFGAGVVAAACGVGTLERALQRRRLNRRGSVTLSIRRAKRARAAKRRARQRSTAVTGLAQAIAAPLAAGDVLRVRGRSQVPVTLLVRARSGSRLIEARFDGLRLSRRCDAVNVALHRSPAGRGLRLSECGSVHGPSAVRRVKIR